MLKTALLSLLFFVGLFTKAQVYNLDQVDNRMHEIPFQKTFSTKEIADFINQNFISEKNKVRAAYFWVAYNIAYNKDSANIINLGVLTQQQKINAALRRKKGVCENFAAIFNDICRQTGINSFIVDGYTKQHGRIDDAGHAWCAVKVEGVWLLCDPTWDAGVSITKYFLAMPEEMIQSHMPYDPMWQLLENPLSHARFYKGDVYNKTKEMLFNYSDSLTTYFGLDSLQKLKVVLARIQKGGLYNKMITERTLLLRMHIEIIRQDKDATDYNTSIADIKNAGNLYNSFIEFRNKKFLSLKANEDPGNLLKQAEQKIHDAKNKLAAIEKSEAVLKFSVDEVQEKINTLSMLIKEQKDFLIQYNRLR